MNFSFILAFTLFSLSRASSEGENAGYAIPRFKTLTGSRTHLTNAIFVEFYLKQDHKTESEKKKCRQNEKTKQDAQLPTRD